MFDALLNELNQQQLEAVTTTEGYIRVIAGAGSGKTKALTRRYAYLVGCMDVSPENILCVTFTNKAAREMKVRVQTILGDIGSAFVCTFHSLCARIIKEDYRVVHFTKDFCIIDEGDRKLLLKEAIEELGIPTQEVTVREAMKYIGRFKAATDYIPLLASPNQEVLERAEEEAADNPTRLCYRYCRLQRKNFGLDFQDLINFGLYILETDDTVRKKWQERFHYVMVDEFQDVSSKQYELCTILSGHHHNLFVVGDPDQTIYTWRGARIDHILQFDKNFPNVKTIMMTQNYRSGTKILSAANALIAKNETRMKKDLFAAGKEEGAAVYFHAKTKKEEAEWVLKHIKLLRDADVSLSSIALLYRAHNVSLSFEEALRLQKIPYVIYSGVPFYSREEIKNTLSYMRMSVADDDIAFLRTINCPRRGVGKTRQQALKDFAAQNGCSLYQALVAKQSDPKFKAAGIQSYIALIEKYRLLAPALRVSDLMEGLLADSGYEKLLRSSGEDDRLDNLAELKQSILRFENEAQEDTSVMEYLNSVALYTNDDKTVDSDSVKLMTIHSAKGLEFDYVFLVAANENILPSRRISRKEELEEERRIAYVAYTRAKKGLFISESAGDGIDGQESYYPSRFIFNTEAENLDYVVPLPSELEKLAKAYILQKEEMLESPEVPHETRAFGAGDRIFHRNIGEGTILENNEEKHVYLIRFDKFETPRELLYSAAEKMTKLAEQPEPKAPDSNEHVLENEPSVQNQEKKKGLLERLFNL